MAKDDLGSFCAKLNAFEVQLHDRLNKLVRNVYFECAENIVVGGAYSPGTPIDTGFARATWWTRVGDDESEEDPLPRVRPKEGKGSRSWRHRDPLAEAVVALANTELGETLYLLSNCAYMGPLEYGHSQQAPTGMIRLTLNAGQQIVDKVAKQMIAATT